jgi:hypothetical protein
MKELKASDLQVGQHVTVFEGRTIALDIHTDAHKGDVLLVIAINNPYVALKHLSHKGNSRFTVDMRHDWLFKALSKEYVSAMLDDEPEPEPEPEKTKA